MKVSFRGFDRAGKAVAGMMEAESIESAKDHLRRDGVYISALVEATASAGIRPGGVSAGFGKGRRLRAMALLMRQLAVLVSTGTTVVEAMTVLERQLPPGKWATVVGDVRKRVEEGSQLSEAMSQHPVWFDAVARSLVAAGESRGKLGDMLERLATLARQQLKIRSAFTGAMVYPCLLMVIAVAVIIAMIGFVMPRFEGLFASLNAPLPPTTAALMAASHWLRDWWWAAIGCGMMAVAGAWYWMQTPGGKRTLDTAFVRMPQIGRVTRAFATARIARLLGVLLEGKVGLLESIELTRAATSNVQYHELLAKAERAVTKGEPVSTAFADTSLINPAVCEAIRSGERTGKIGSVLMTLADFMDEDNEVVIKSLTTLIEPLILIGLGLIVGVMAASMFLPLFDLSASAAGGG